MSEDTGFYIGGAAFADLSNKVAAVHKHMTHRGDTRPVYKPVSGSVVVPNPAPAFVTVTVSNGPARGRTWNILKVILSNGVDVHTGVFSPISPQPAVPASAATVINSFGQTMQVTITGGTVTAVTINGASAPATSGVFYVPAGQGISITYSAPPTWVWALPTQADVYAGTAPDIMGASLDNAIIGGASVPSTNNITKGVDWCASGETVFATVFGCSPGQQIALTVRVAEYPMDAVEAESV